MKPSILALAGLLFLAACSKVNQEQEVIAILGTPTESNSVNILGVSGTASRWVGGDAVITVRFVNGKVALKTFDQPGAPQK